MRELYNTEMEKAVLGAFLLKGDAAYEYADSVTEETFFELRHQALWRIIANLIERSDKIDVLTVSAEMSAMCLHDTVGTLYLMDLTNGVMSHHHLSSHFSRLKELEYMRRTHRTGQQLQEIVNDAQITSVDVLDKAQLMLSELTISEGSKEKTAMDIAQRATERMDMLMNRKGGIIGIPTGFKDLDKKTNGWQEPDLVIIAARPGMGKTSLALSSFLSIARQGVPTGFFSLEMSDIQLFHRMLSMDSHVPLWKIKDPGLLNPVEKQKVYDSRDRLAELNYYVDDRPGLSINEVRSVARRWVRRYGVRIIFVDYLQLMQGDKKGNREVEVSSISKGLKGIAKELDVPVIALSQLSRAVETRGGDKRPLLSDLRESGSLEQDSDLVGFIYRPEYYDIMEDEDGNSTKGLAEFIIAKHRNGPTGSVLLAFVAEKTEFCDYKEEDVFALPPSVSDNKVTVQPDTSRDIPF